jgi:hypothetical protein
MKKIICIAIFLLIIFGRNICSSQEAKDTLKILFVGNSYTYFENLPQLISIISDSLKTKLVTKKSVIGGAYLSEHWRGKRGLQTKEMIKNGGFDIVVLQGQSMEAIYDQDSINFYLRLFCDYIRDNGAKPYLYLTWAREKVPQYQETINNVYLNAATKNDAIIVPVGKAWALARQMRPDFKLYYIDGSHPSELGAFLTACVFVSTILNELPDNLPSSYYTKDIEKEYIELMRLDTLDVIFCKKIAEEICKIKSKSFK